MWKNYLTTAARNFVRNRTYSLINLTGLTFGIICTMLIFQYVVFENSADSFHIKKDRLYRVAFTRVVNGGTPETFSQIYLGAGEAFQSDIPGVENLTRIRADFFQEGPTVSYTSSKQKIAFKDVGAIIADSTFFEVFTFPLIKGDMRSALKGVNSTVITERMSKMLFGESEAIGKVIEYSMNQGTHFLEITGIVKDVPANSHIQFDIILPLQHYLNSIPPQARQYYSAWNFKEFTTYVTLCDGTDANAVETLMDQVINKNLGEQLKDNNTTLSATLQPMNSVYYDRETNLGTVGFGSALLSTRTGNKRMMYFFSVIAVITIAISLMSYINLSTIRSLDRAKEVGVRKVIGANKNHLRIQFMFESILMNFAALVLATTVIALLIPSFNQFVGSSFTITSWFNESFLFLLAAVFTSGVLLSGLYPAFIMSSFKPIAALKGHSGTITSKSQLRKVFVVLQYTPAIALLVCTIVVYEQLEYMRKMDVGLEMKELITVRSPRFIPEGMQSFEAEAMFKNELQTISSVHGASFAGNQAGRGLNFLVPFLVDSVGDSGIAFFKGTGVDHDFANVFGLKLVAGAPFVEGMESLYGDKNNFVRKVLVNETAVRNWGFKKNDAVGRVLTSADGSRYYIQGILEDFNWASVHRATDPVMLWYTPNNRFMTIRLAPDADPGKTVAQIKTIYDKLFPADVFHYEFAEDVYNNQYNEDEKYSNLFIVFSGMAILIASIGLFGLSAFSAERRSKEVSIRKVLGANISQIVKLLSIDFIVLVLIASVIASPIAWITMSQWLENFAFHTDLNVAPFLMTTVGCIIIAFLTVSLKSLMVANANPVEKLKSE